MTWKDFSSAGFLRDDSPLSDTLQFAAPLQTTIQTWPAVSDDIHRKLKKQQKVRSECRSWLAQVLTTSGLQVLPTFGWETTPVAGQEWVVEEAFLDCWADLIWSSGWSEREERTHRDSNWAMVRLDSYLLFCHRRPCVCRSTSRLCLQTRVNRAFRPNPPTRARPTSGSSSKSLSRASTATNSRTRKRSATRLGLR